MLYFIHPCHYFKTTNLSLTSMSLVIFCLLFSFVDYVPVKGEIIWYLFSIMYLIFEKNKVEHITTKQKTLILVHSFLSFSLPFLRKKELLKTDEELFPPREKQGSWSEYLSAKKTSKSKAAIDIFCKEMLPSSIARHLKSRGQSSQVPSHFPMRTVTPKAIWDLWCQQVEEWVSPLYHPPLPPRLSLLFHTQPTPSQYTHSPAAQGFLPKDL